MCFPSGEHFMPAIMIKSYYKNISSTRQKEMTGLNLMSWNNENNISDGTPVNTFGAFSLENLNKIILAGHRIVNGKIEYLAMTSELISENFFTINSADAPIPTISPRLSLQSTSLYFT